MKKITLIAAIALASASASAQDYNLTVTKTNGQTVVIPTDEIAKMEFVGYEAVDPVTGAPKADLLDIVFKADGTAEDVSPLRNTVITKPAPTLMTYFSEMHNRYVANFRNPIGQGVIEGYYRVNYTPNGDFINRIADGCTMESIVMLGETDPPTMEVKWFSSMQGGGIGFLIPAHNASNPGTQCLTFLPNVSTTGGSNWRWTYSSVKPEVGTYYHVVGVYNKEEGKSYIYINGELSGTCSTPGNYVPVASGAESFVIGGDPASNQTDCHSSWCGDVVTARIYSEPMNAEQVKKLWEAAKFDTTKQSITVTNLKYIQECEVAEGYRYTFYGDGLKSGDTVALQPNGSNETIAVESICDGSKATFTIPASLTSGTYRVVIKRDNITMPLFAVKFNVSSNPILPVTPKVIAHRGEHTGGATENSIAALVKAMKSNYYGIELDVWITTDDVIVVHHDGVANGLTFQNCTYNQIKNITLSNGEKLPTFESFLTNFVANASQSDSKLIVEIKTHSNASRLNACVDKAMAMIKDAGIADRVEYIAFSYDACKRIHANQPDAAIGYLSGNLAPATVLNDGIVSIDYSTTAFTSHPEWIKQARDLGMIVNVWTVNSEIEMLKYIGLGANYITTDAPATLTELCKMTFLEPKQSR